MKIPTRASPLEPTPVIILLGPSGKPLDLSMWHAHCQQRLGFTVTVGQKLTAKQWAKLGYSHVAAMGASL